MDKNHDGITIFKKQKNWRECVGIEPTQEALNPSY